jgi:hypothetical protein
LFDCQENSGMLMEAFQFPKDCPPGPRARNP